MLRMIIKEQNKHIGSWEWNAQGKSFMAMI